MRDFHVKTTHNGKIFFSFATHHQGRGKQGRPGCGTGGQRGRGGGRPRWRHPIQSMGMRGGNGSGGKRKADFGGVVVVVPPCAFRVVPYPQWIVMHRTRWALGPPHRGGARHPRRRHRRRSTSTFLLLHRRCERETQHGGRGTKEMGWKKRKHAFALHRWHIVPREHTPYR